jgi:predicted PolB exonuclease-like 3'-5' exonuclease
VTISNVLVFDIETVPDVEFGRRLHGLEGLTDKQVGYVMQTRQREQTGSEFLSLEQHRVVAISVAMRLRDTFKVWSLGEPDSGEAELVQRFFDGIERIRNYCETDVLNTYLIYLRFELMRGRLGEAEHAAECERVRESLRAACRPHLEEFLAAWE